MKKLTPLRLLSFPIIKERVDQNNGSEIAGVEHLIEKYQIDGNDAYSVGRDRQFGGFKHTISGSPVVKGRSFVC